MENTNIERTYIMLKPDAYSKGIMGKVISRIEEEGFKIVNMKMFKLSQEILDEHYAHITHLSFYPDIAEFMMSAPVVGMIVEGENVISRMRQIMGPTKYDEEKSKGTIRGDFQDRQVTMKNVIHGSDSVESANAEIKRFFGDEIELVKK